jgi:hypothetical protein
LGEINYSYSKLQEKRHKLSEMIPLDAPLSLFVDPTNCCNNCEILNSLPELDNLDDVSPDIFY